MTEKYNYQKKLENLEDLQLTSNLLILQEQIAKWCDKNPKNENLLAVREALLNVTFIVNKYQVERGTYHLALEDYRSRELRAITRAREADKRIEWLEAELEIHNKKKELGL